jgi:hypothetical protein
VLWNYFVRSSPAGIFSYTGDFPTNNSEVSTGKLFISIANQTGELQISGSDQLLKSGAIGNQNIPGNTFDITLKANPGFSTGPGIYGTTLLYTLTIQ